MEWEYTDEEVPVTFAFKVDTREKFAEKLDQFTADMLDLDLQRTGDGDILDYL